MLEQKLISVKGNQEYPALSQAELIEFIKKKYYNINIIDLDHLLYAKFITRNKEKCLIYEEFEGGFESKSSISFYKIFIFDLTQFKSKDIIESPPKNLFDKEQYLEFLKLSSQNYIILNLELLTDLSYKNYEWSALLSKSNKPFKSNLFKELTYYIYQQLINTK